jgi:endoribonuclease Dicer
MVGYIQSRGRARQKAATFVVMVQEGQATHVERYKSFSESEPQLRLVYQNREDLPKPVQEDELEEGEEREDPLDLAERERYVVPNTGAILTYNTSIGLLNHLCSLIPRDRFTPIHLPQYSGEFEAVLQLPSSLPLPKEHLTFNGPTKRTKKEAKRAAAFMAVKRLHELGVFDDYLLPARSATGDNDDADGRPIGDVSQVPDMMDVIVRDPWTRGQKLWLHTVRLDGQPTAGLITGSILPPADLVCNGTYVSTDAAELIEFDEEDEWEQRRSLEDFMRMGLWWCITGRGITLPMTCYLVPVTHDLTIDWDAIGLAVAHPYGINDWSTVSEEHYDTLLVMCRHENGRPLILKNVRHDLTPLSVPPPGSREAAGRTYRDFYIAKYTRRGIPPDIPEDGLCVEAVSFPRHTTTVYALDGSYTPPVFLANPSEPLIFPAGICKWAPLSPDIYRSFRVLPELMHRLTDLYRAHATRVELGLPPIQDDLLVQALTLPSANAGFNNQRLETLGDSVLKLCTVVHLYNRFPHRHEGQLDILRRNSVSNRTLLARAKEVGLERYLTSEPQTMRIWRYVLSPEKDSSETMPSRFVERRIPKRSLQDCMEASLGAGFATGGISMAIRVGNALGLGFGGPLPWPARYDRLPESPVPAMFAEVQEILGYEFKSGQLLIEAVTHPSFRSPHNSSYQRLEFMGDGEYLRACSEFC